MTKRIASVILGLTVVMTLMAPVGAQEAVSTSEFVEVIATPNTQLTPLAKQLATEADTPDVYLVRLETEPLGQWSLNRGQAKLDVKSGPARAHARKIAREQDDVITAIEGIVGGDVEIRERFVAGNNGISLTLSPAQAAQVSMLARVVYVQRNLERELHTDAGPAWIGAPTLWDGTAAPSGIGNMGEGMVVGIIDTGINPLNPSFADVGGDGYDHTNPKGQFFGVCDVANASYDASFSCNDKLIGAWGYSSVNGGDPTDYDGHGSHTASTAAGNFVTATVDGPTTSISVDISGVAPHANIIAYSACCTLEALTAGIEQAILDGVDAINYSIGSSSGTADFWGDFDTIGFLNARAAGIFVATSAGNDGPAASTLGSPADAPWLTATANLTHNRKYTNSVGDFTGGDTPPPSALTGKGFTSAFGPAPIVYAGDFGDPLCGLGAFAPGTFSGQIVVCDRGTHGRVDKGQAVLDGGAGGYILANDPASGDSLVGDAHVLPAVHISNTDGVALLTWMSSGADHMATITGRELSVADSNGDVMSASSSRGPNQADADILQPSVGAPGTDIIAAYGIGGEVIWDFLSGTSMASPHVAGSALLVASEHPDWTPTEVQSALMMTADQSVVKEDGVTPADAFDTGAGRVDLSAAARAGLVMNETPANYLASDPSLGGDVKTLNTVNLANKQCLGTCSWTRTVRSSLAVSMDWTASGAGDAGVTVSPESFTLAAGETQVLTITANVQGMPLGGWLFGQVNLVAVSEDVPAAHLPIAVSPSNGVLPDGMTIHTRANSGSQVLDGFSSVAADDLTVTLSGLQQGDLTELALAQDSDNTDALDDLGDGVYWTTIEVPEDSQRLVAEVIASESPDLDMFVGTGDTPSAASTVCVSASGTALERCDLSSPAAGNYWVVIQNWAASAPGAVDAAILSTAVVGPDRNNMSVDGPASVEELEPYSLTVFWDTPWMEAGDRWYGAISLGTDAGNPGNIGTVPVDVVRHGDDVTVTASQEEVKKGDIVTFEIIVDSNVTPEDLAMELQAWLPPHLNYIEGTASEELSIVGRKISWSGVLSSAVGAEGHYNMTTSEDDAACSTGFGFIGPGFDTYIDLEALGIFANAGISGDSVTFALQDEVSFYGSSGDVSITDDGFLVFDTLNNYGGATWLPQVMPDAVYPNNVAAMLWQDMQIYYDADSNSGVSIANAGPTYVIEYDNIRLWADDAGVGPVFDFEAIVNYDVNNAPGAYEIVYAYGEMGDVSGATVGVENASATQGSTLGMAPYAGLNVCFDYEGPSFEPIVLTFDALVTSWGRGAPVAVVVHHSTDNPGAHADYVHANVYIASRRPNRSGGGR